MGKVFNTKSTLNSKTAFQNLISLLLNKAINNEGSHQLWAVRDVSLTVQPGDSIGVIGLNGSGKTTLMKLICGLLKADEGTVQNGFFTQQMINLGAGFDPIQNAVENLKTELVLRDIPHSKHDALIQQILKFAELEAFADLAVGKLSSGMAARLGFSLCVHSSPELLIIDEALSVGDERFRNKCLVKMQELREQNVAMIFVSHSMTHVSLFCDKTIWINKGHVAKFGDTKSVIESYLAHIYDAKDNRNADETTTDLGEEDSSKKSALIQIEAASQTEDIISKYGVDIDFDEGDSTFGTLVPPTDAITNIWFKPDSSRLTPESALKLALGFTLLKPISDLQFTLNILSETFELITSISTLNFDLPRKAKAGDLSFEVTIEKLCLSPGKYHVTMPIHNGPSYLFRGLVWHFTVGSGKKMSWGMLSLAHEIKLR